MASNTHPNPLLPVSELFLWLLAEPDKRRLVGTLRLLVGSGAQANSVSLEYAPSWLTNGFALSEDLPLQAGEQLPFEPGCAAGAVDDARPDRWGERVIGHLLNPPRLSTLDFLFFAGDQRFGALGVSRQANQYLPFDASALPTVDDVASIFDLVRAVENREPIAEHLNRLISPGTTLGGARPKALVSIAGQPWVIKFAEHGDILNSPAIEHAAMTLSKRAGINSCDTELLSFMHAQRSCHALLVKRFDRNGLHRRHAISARVGLIAAGSRFGYPELALLLRRRGLAGEIDSNGEQIFRRMIFNILIDNTDDHEKNHALLLRTDGLYDLAPAFDVLPSGFGLGYQQMRVGKRGAEGSVENALSEASAFRLTQAKARAIATQIATVVNEWQPHFASAGVSPHDVAELSRSIDGPRLLAERLTLLHGGKGERKVRGRRPIKC